MATATANPERYGNHVHGPSVADDAARLGEFVREAQRRPRVTKFFHAEPISSPYICRQPLSDNTPEK